MYDAAIGRWWVVDGMSELYFASSSYVYALNNPINAIDPDGNLVIFINGYTLAKRNQGTQWYWREYTLVPNVTHRPTQWGDSGSPIYQPLQTGRAFDVAVSNRLNDQNRYYVHGGNNASWSARISKGKQQGYADAALLVNRITNKYGNITETIKIITHSMGAAFGKGYVKGLIKYLKEKKLYYKGLISLVVDYDPHQADKLTADEETYTIQEWHDGGIFGLADKVQGGAQEPNEDKGESSHSLMSFFNSISNLPTGTYIWNENTEQWDCTNCKD